LSSVRVKSALPPIADIRRCRWDVRKVPTADVEGLLIRRMRFSGHEDLMTFGLLKFG
jgi:hypothetical protein